MGKRGRTSSIFDARETKNRNMMIMLGRYGGDDMIIAMGNDCS
jgi:hypothetical protein